MRGNKFEITKVRMFKKTHVKRGDKYGTPKQASGLNNGSDPGHRNMTPATGAGANHKGTFAQWMPTKGND